MNGVVTYLTFDGNCRQAMEFYSKCLGGQVMMMPFSEAPGGPPKDSPMGGRIMHSRVTKNGMPLLMASDSQPGTPLTLGNNFSVSIGCESVAEIDSIFAALSEGGSVTMPLGDQFWGARFGMLKDQFGIHWMLNYEYPKK